MGLESPCGEEGGTHGSYSSTRGGTNQGKLRKSGGGKEKAHLGQIYCWVKRKTGKKKKNEDYVVRPLVNKSRLVPRIKKPGSRNRRWGQ